MAEHCKFVFPRVPEREGLPFWFVPPRTREGKVPAMHFYIQPDDQEADKLASQQLELQTQRLHAIFERESALLHGDCTRLFVGGTAQGGKRDDGLERRQFAVEQTDTFWLAEGYHQEYWQKWRPRYAALFALVGLQYADSKLDFLPPAADAACTILAVGIGLLFLGERVLDSETTKLGA